MTDPNVSASPVHGAFDINGQTVDDPRNGIIQGGLTKREHFAAISDVKIEEYNIETIEDVFRLKFPNKKNGYIEDIPSTRRAVFKFWIDVEAKFKVMKADALIEALNKEEQ